MPAFLKRPTIVEPRKLRRISRVRSVLNLIVHACQCRRRRGRGPANCQYPNCGKVNELISHGIQCKTRASGGCFLCKKMWYLLQMHSRQCKNSHTCQVPRCRDLKQVLSRLQQQQQCVSVIHGQESSTSCQIGTRT